MHFCYQARSIPTDNADPTYPMGRLLNVALIPSQAMPPPVRRSTVPCSKLLSVARMWIRQRAGDGRARVLEVAFPFLKGDLDAYSSRSLAGKRQGQDSCGCEEQIQGLGEAQEEEGTGDGNNSV